MTQRVTVITGGAGALGSAVARLLLKHGHRVGLVDVPAAKARLEALINELGANVAAAELPDAAAWSGVVSRFESALGPVTGAVLTAGGWKGGAAIGERNDEETVWRSMMESNLESAHAALRAVLPGMVTRRDGSVVVIGSQAVERPWLSAGAAAYAASKAAVVALAQTTAQEVLAQGVRINAVLPSTMDTPANRRSMPTANFSSWVTTESAAEVIAFLLSESARDVSGAALPVYGRVGA